MLIIEKIGYLTNYLRAIEWFEEYLVDCVLMTELIEKFPNYLYFWHKKDGIVLEYNIKNEYFHIKYENVWRVFESNFGLNRLEIKQLTASILEQHTKQKVVTTNPSFLILALILEQHTKQEVI